MRIQFKKGFTPEQVADSFIRFIKKNDFMIGNVNIYFQVYDEDMKLVFEPEGWEGRYLEVMPDDELKKDYEDDIVNYRRGKMKAV